MPWALWYEENAIGLPEPTQAPWDDWEKMAQRAANPLPVTIRSMQENPIDDVSQHLPTLALLIG